MTTLVATTWPEAVAMVAFCVFMAVFIVSWASSEMGRWPWEKKTRRIGNLRWNDDARRNVPEKIEAVSDDEEA